MSMPSRSFTHLSQYLQDRSLDRRELAQLAGILGFTAASAPLLMNQNVAAQADSSEMDGIGRPAAGTANQERGAGGELRLLSWQAASTLAAHNSQGGKDYYPAALVSEPLLCYSASGELLPLLCTEVPTLENGRLSEDLLSARFTILPDVIWSDGEPVTSSDIVFTWQWITNENNASLNMDIWGTIDSIDAEDDKNVVVHFKQARVNWFDPFVTVVAGSILPAHVFGNDPNNKNDAFLSNPIGTGPYVVESFEPNDSAVFAINKNYRESNKPYFSKITLKGGGDAIATAMAVVQTGDYDYAWNVQAEPDLIREINENGEHGELVGVQTTNVETIFFNFSDPNTEVDGQRSQKDTPHPFLTDPAVREAISLAIDRGLIAEKFYGEADSATSNILAGSAAFDMRNTSWEYDLDKAAQTLEDAGWVMDGNVRTKDGVSLSLTFGTAVNVVRQKTQAVIKAALEEIGFEVTLDQVDSSAFFDSSAGNDLNTAHFYSDMLMWSNGSGAPISPRYMLNWYAGPDGDNLAQKENDWSGQNFQRYQNPEFDTLFDQLASARSFDEAMELLTAMNDLIINDTAVVPLVARTFYYGIANRLNRTNMDLGNVWVGPYDNIANWNTNEG